MQTRTRKAPGGGSSIDLFGGYGDQTRSDRHPRKQSKRMVAPPSIPERGGAANGAARTGSTAAAVQASASGSAFVSQSSVADLLQKDAMKSFRTVDVQSTAFRSAATDYCYYEEHAPLFRAAAATTAEPIALPQSFVTLESTGTAAAASSTRAVASNGTSSGQKVAGGSKPQQAPTPEQPAAGRAPARGPAGGPASIGDPVASLDPAQRKPPSPAVVRAVQRQRGGGAAAALAFGAEQGTPTAAANGAVESREQGVGRVTRRGTRAGAGARTQRLDPASMPAAGSGSGQGASRGSARTRPDPGAQTAGTAAGASDGGQGGAPAPAPAPVPAQAPAQAVPLDSGVAGVASGAGVHRGRRHQAADTSSVTSAAAGTTAGSAASGGRRHLAEARSEAADALGYGGSTNGGVTSDGGDGRGASGVTEAGQLGRATGRGVGGSATGAGGAMPAAGVASARRGHSSSEFARGSAQNEAGTVTGRPSTRVLRQTGGGGSQVSAIFGGWGS